MFSTQNGTYFSFLMHFKMLSAICFNFDQSKILSSGNGLSLDFFKAGIPGTVASYSASRPPYFQSICQLKSGSLFSSPEHNVLRGSYCDRSSSVRLSVRPSICPSVNNFFKNLLLQNQKANLDKTWQECSLGEALQKLLKEFNSNKNSGCHGNKMAENGKNL